MLFYMATIIIHGKGRSLESGQEQILTGNRYIPHG